MTKAPQAASDAKEGRRVATLIAAPARPALEAGLVGALAARLPGARAPRWLDEGVAADIEFDAPAPGAGPDGALADDLRAALGGAPVDVVVGPLAGRRKKLFLADMDSTIIEQECIDELADFVGVKDQVAAITEQAMRGEIAFEPALRQRVALLKGLPETVVDEVIETRVTLTPGARTLLATLRAHGVRTALVSGGFRPFTERIAAKIGFDENRANSLIVENGVFAGAVAEPILGAAAKLEALEEMRGALGLPAAAVLAVGDGANDIPMLRAAGLGVAFRAKPKTAAQAGARIDHGDLTALLYAQGYDGTEFVG